TDTPTTQIHTLSLHDALPISGTAGRNLVYGPGFVNWDFSAFKNFPITESKKVQFRAEFFNLFNQVNFNNPNAVLTSPSFGRILGDRKSTRLNSSHRTISYAVF